MLTDGVLTNRVRVGVWYVAEDRDRPYDGSEPTANPLQEETEIRVPLATVDVRLTTRFGVQAAAAVPDVTRSAIVARPSGDFHFQETFHGLGDISLLGWFRFRLSGRWNATASAGMSLPAGKTEQPRFRATLEQGSLVPTSRLQRGTGTFDPLLGLSIDRRTRLATLLGSVAARLPVSENRHGLRTGASWEANGGASRPLGTHRLVGFARLGWLHRQQDVFEGTPVLVGGGNWLYFTPGIAVAVGKGLQAQAEVKLPVHRSLANRQLDSSAIVQFGVSRAFGH